MTSTTESQGGRHKGAVGTGVTATTWDGLRRPLDHFNGDTDVSRAILDQWDGCSCESRRIVRGRSALCDTHWATASAVSLPGSRMGPFIRPT